MNRTRMWVLAAVITAAGWPASPVAGAASVPASAAEVVQKPAPKKPAPKVVQITIDKATFGDAPAGVAVGDTIEWVNTDIFDHTATAKAGPGDHTATAKAGPGDHTATAKTGVFDVVIPAGKKARVVMKKAGTFEYYCRYHPNMVATVTVKKS